MKTYKSILDVVLLACLAVISLVAIAPEVLVMPNTVQMLFITTVLGLMAAFLVLLWRENPSDEREIHNQAVASRSAYIVGAIVLIGALFVQSIRHHIDPVIPIALLAMIATKIIVQRNKDNT